jgi:hypothetical protein
MPGVDPKLLDLLRKMLRYEEGDRITVEEMKEHPYIKE